MKTHKYSVTIEFESEIPVKLVDQGLVQFENALPYFLDPKSSRQKESVNNTFVYGSGKIKLKEIKK